MNLGTTPVGTPITKVLTINNLNNGSLNFTGSPMVSVTGTGFSVATNPTASIASASSSSLTLQFNPSAGGLATGTLSIANNDSDENPFTLNLQATGTTTTNAYSLTLTTTGGGTGTISSSGTPTGLSCGADCLTYISTTTVTLTAAGTNGSTFVDWSYTPAFTSGNVLTANTTCTATFEAPAPLPHYHLSVQTDGTGTGNITGAGSYPAGTTVTLEAIPDKGSTFVGWSAGCSNVMILTADITCTATFMGPPPPRTLYISFAGTGQGQLSGGLASDATGINCSSATPPCSYTVFGPQWVYPKFMFRIGRLVGRPRVYPRWFQ